MKDLGNNLFAVIVPKGSKSHHIAFGFLILRKKSGKWERFLNLNQHFEILLTVTKDEILGDAEILPGVYELLQKNDVWFVNPIPPFKERMNDFREAENKVVDKVVIIKKV